MIGYQIRDFILYLQAKRRKGVNMKYKGFIFGSITPVKAAGVDPAEMHYFRMVGFWIDGNNRKVGSYVLSDDKGNEIEGLKYLQFSRSRNNEFYLESVG